MYRFRCDSLSRQESTEMCHADSFLCEKMFHCPPPLSLHLQGGGGGEAGLQGHFLTLEESACLISVALSNLKNRDKILRGPLPLYTYVSWGILTRGHMRAKFAGWQEGILTLLFFIFDSFRAECGMDLRINAFLVWFCSLQLWWSWHGSNSWSSCTARGLGAHSAGHWHWWAKASRYFHLE